MLPPHDDVTPEAEDEARLIVGHLMAREHLPVTSTELDRLIVAYRELRDISDMLFAVTEARYESSALIFEPVPRFGDWWTEEVSDGTDPAHPVAPQSIPGASNEQGPR